MEPEASRPFMPGYGLVGPEEGTGLLPWSWAVERLTASHDYWVATVWPDGRPHVTPVWGIWHDGCVWFSCSPRSRKARNLEADDRCVVTTDNPLEPVVVEGRAERRRDRADAELFTEQTNRKYGSDNPADFVAANALFRVRPAWVVALTEEDFTGSPTRWRPAG
jgi:general stress protein 26